MKHATRLLACLVFFALGSCNKHNQGSSSPSLITLDRSSIRVGAIDGYTDSFTVRSSAPWKLSLNLGSDSGKSWLGVSAMQGMAGITTVKLTVTGVGTATQTAGITVSLVSDSTKTSSLTVTQKIYTIPGQTVTGGSLYEAVYGLAQTTNGDLIPAASSVSSDYDVPKNYGSYDFWARKFDANGKPLSSLSMGGSSSDLAFAVSATQDGGYILGGYTQSSKSGWVGANHGALDMWIVRLNAQDDTVWTRVLGGAGQDIASAIAPAPDSGFLVAGYTTSSNSGDVGMTNGNTDMWVVKLDKNGDTIWTRAFGGSITDAAYAVTASPGGGYVMAGATNSSGSGDIPVTQGNYDLWIIKVDENGNKVWSRTFGGSGDDEARTITATPDGGYLVAGYTSSNNSGDVGATNGYYDWFILKIDANGNEQWLKTMGGDGNDAAYSVTLTPDGGYFLAGSTNSDPHTGDIGSTYGNYDLWLVELNASGQVLWNQTYGGSSADVSSFAGIVALRNGGFAIATNTFSIDGVLQGTTIRGEADMWLLRIQ